MTENLAAEASSGLVMELREVHVSYGTRDRGRHVDVLKGLSLGVPAGRTVGLVGESGSGKSTVGKVTLGLVPPSAGTVLFQAAPLTRQRLKGRAQLVPQDPQWSLDPRLRVRDSISEPLAVLGAPRKESEARVGAVLDRVGLTLQQASRMPYELSGGQRQRAAIARALVSNPVYLVCDEITSALDVTVQLQVLNVLRDVQEERHISVLFISHDLGAVRYVAHDVVTLHRGMVQWGEDESTDRGYSGTVAPALPKVRSEEGGARGQ